MSNHHRITQIDAWIRSGGYPNCRQIAERFEISTRQAARDIEYLRYSMGAPVQYNHRENGYSYTDDTFALPAQIISEVERKTLAYLAEQYRRAGSGPALQLAELFLRISGNTPRSRRPGEPRTASALPVLDPEPFPDAPGWTRQPYAARVRFDNIPDFAGGDMSISRVEDTTYDITFTSSRVLLSALLSQPAPFRILSPGWLREKLLRRLNRLLDQHEAP